MRTINVLLAIFVSLFLGILVLEGGLRLFPAFRPEKSINEFHPKLGWAKRPGATATRKTNEFDIRFEINEQGLRDDPVAREKPAGTFRVLCLGDSFTLGYTVDREHLFVDQIERYWRTEERRVEVINAGTEGYSTDQEVLWFLEEGRDYDPDLVLLFPYENDVYWNGQQQYTRYPKPRFTARGAIEARGLMDPGPLPVVMKVALGQFAAKILVPLLLEPDPTRDAFQPAGTDVWVRREFAPLFHDTPEFLIDAQARTKGALAALKRETNELGARLIVVPIPSESAIHPAEKERFRAAHLDGLADELWSPDRPVDFFRDSARELGLEVVAARAALRAAAADGDELYFRDEWHFTPAGNATFARALVDGLEALDVFPSEHSALSAGTFEIEDTERTVPDWIKLFGALWLVLGTCFLFTYPKEPKLLSFLKVGGMLALVFTIFATVRLGLVLAGPYAPWVLLAFAGAVLGFVIYKLGRRVGTIAELLRSFTLRGHWYLMPLVVVLLSIGSLLVVAASSPVIAPFIYTLF
ncbi:MAG: DUF5989 family protein [Planctomycetota bacterium]